jgi:DegV family protein with EDD domain
MAVHVVTDNVADLPQEVVSDLGLTVVPLGVSFGEETGAEAMSLDVFYRRLAASDSLPTTSAPNPQAFARAYEAAAARDEDVVVITISAKLSATIDMARQARALVRSEKRIEVFDSTLAAMAEGLVVMQAAEAAKDGATVDEVLAEAERAIPRIGFLAAFDDLEYLRRGGRIGAAKALLGSLLHIHPLITLRDGIVSPYGRTRSRIQALARLTQFIEGFRSVETLAIEHTDCAADAAGLRERLAPAFPGVPIYESRATPVIGTHTGPGLVVVTAMGDR